MSKPFREPRFGGLRVKGGTPSKGNSMTRPQPIRRGALALREARLARGMTLIEILVVLVLIGGIVFSILLGVMGMSELVQ